MISRAPFKAGLTLRFWSQWPNNNAFSNCLKRLYDHRCTVYVYMWDCGPVWRLLADCCRVFLRHAKQYFVT